MKKMTRTLLINWLYFEKQIVELSNINFLTGKNSAGKSTFIDALQVVLLGEISGRNFNKAANKGSERTIDSYLRADTGDGGKGCRHGKTFSTYIACEFEDDLAHRYFTIGVVFDCYSDGSYVNHFLSFDGPFPEHIYWTNMKGVLAFLGDRAQYRRILLKCDRKGFPEYEYTNVQIRDAFNSAVLSMAKEQIVFYQWVNGREEKVLQEIWLNAECLEQAYATAGRSSLSKRIRDLDIMLKTTADQCLTAWIKTGLLATDAEMCSRRKLFGFLNAGENLIHGVLDALSAVDKLNGSYYSVV